MKTQFIKDLVKKALYFYVPIIIFVGICILAQYQNYDGDNQYLYFSVITFLLIPICWYGVGKIYNRIFQRKYFKKIYLLKSYKKSMIKFGRNKYIEEYRKIIDTNIIENVFKIFLIIVLSALLVPYVFIIAPISIYCLVRDYIEISKSDKTSQV